MMLLKVALTVIVMGILRVVVVAVRVTDELYRLNWEFCMDGMEKELVLSQERRKRDLNYLRYYRGTE